MALWAALLLTLALSLLLPLAVRPLLIRLGIVDVPNERSSHERPVLRGLGLAVLLAMTLGGGTACALLSAGSADGGGPWASARGAATLALVVGGFLASGLLGLAEDLRGLSVPVRSAILLAIAAASAGGLLWTVHAQGQATVIWVPGIHAGHWPVWMLVLLGVYGVLFISGYINVANFMDGLNGISGFHGVIAGLTFAVSGWFMGYAWLSAAGLAIAAGFAGFLPWNLSRPGAFLGDVGSYLLGGSVAVTSFAAFVNGVPVLATIGPMVVYFGDVAVTLAKRLRAGRKWDEPHKEHVYQRLQQLGLGHVQASGVVALFTLAASVLGLLSFAVPSVWWLLLLAAGLGVLVLYLSLPRILSRRRHSV
ncbi:UDP-phosphate alpha-N-acetyl-D-fucosaminephosphotransferase [Leucobacter weissii]|uniref:UDP-phosphate alpha-N-acetyl-D-fucosaminephosphotransferase n=1 Tax=Leucobacter weissii TaxID=1983706 RepID=A0A939SAV8_9MICO|nr:UDP-phosphate alpha-N-acetyl-D-fucosaminephosphotransferase [Leucobacter weissii]